MRFRLPTLGFSSVYIDEYPGVNVIVHSVIKLTLKLIFTAIIFTNMSLLTLTIGYHITCITHGN